MINYCFLILVLMLIEMQESVLLEKMVVVKLNLYLKLWLVQKNLIVEKLLLGIRLGWDIFLKLMKLLDESKRAIDYIRSIADVVKNKKWNYQRKSNVRKLPI